jgi:hypothetical protein
MSRRMLTSLKWSITGGMSFSGYRAMLEAMLREEYDSKKCAYVGRHAREQVGRDAARGLVVNDANVTINFQQRRFPEFESEGIDGYNGHIPSRPYLKSVFVSSIQAEADVYDTLMALHANTDIISADDSYKVCKRMFKIRKVKLCVGLFTVINNRNGCVILQLLTQASGGDVLVPSLRQVTLSTFLIELIQDTLLQLHLLFISFVQLNSVRESMGFKPLELVYVDNPRQTEGLWTKCFPDLARPTSDGMSAELTLRVVSKPLDVPTELYASIVKFYSTTTGINHWYPIPIPIPIPLPLPLPLLSPSP